MDELLRISILPLLVTLGAYQIGLVCQKKVKSALCNPIVIAVIIVLIFLKVTNLSGADYRKGTALTSWLLTPATVSLAIPMYEQLRVLRSHLKGILAGVACGATACLLMIVLLAALAGLDRTLSVSLLPKSVTTAIGVPLSEMSGGISSITTAAIIFTGILANVLSGSLFRLFRLTDPVAKGVALGTSGHVIATAKANELSQLTGAVSSLSLVTAGILTAVLFPLVLRLTI